MRRFLYAAIALQVASPVLAEPIERARIEVADGDTIRVDGRRVRLLGFDAPETGPDTARCDAEVERGKLAATRLAQIISSGNLDIEYRRRLDRYKRRLARLTVDGENVGAILIRERLAVRYFGRGPKMDWCPRYRR